jgi:TolB-like protein/Tfp pilus assembly protein PilF
MKRCPQCNRVETDDALVFCRVDGTALISDLGSITGDAGTAKFGSGAVSREIETSILPHVTDASMSSPTAPTTVLPEQQTQGTTRELSKPKRRRPFIVVALLITAVVAVTIVIAGYFYYSRKGTTAIESIAVLPFENRSGSPDTDYLSDGLTESLIYRLSQLPNLKVSPTSSVFRFKGKDVDAQKIAADLGVNAVMTGRMVQRADNLTISVELIDTRNNKVLWGEQYERKMSELLATQREIATAIAEKLQLKLSGDDAKGVTKRYTNSNEAYQLYLKGRFYWNKRTADGLKQGAEFYKQAIEKDPAFALAYSGLAESYVLFSAYSVASPKDSMPQSKAAALKALELDESLAEPHAALGAYYSGYEYNFQAAEDELRRSIKLNPNYATAYHWLGNILPAVRKNDEAIAAARRAEELDPLSAIISADTAFDLFMLRRYDDAIAQAQHTLLLDPNFYYAHYLIGKAYNKKGMYKEAVASLRKSVELNPDPITKAMLAQSLAMAGQRAEATRLLAELKADSARRYIPGYFLAPAYLAIGENDAAMALLEKDINERSIYMQWIAVDPELDGLRSDPRFAALVKKVETSKLD